MSDACKRYGVELPKPFEPIAPTVVAPLAGDGEEWRAVPGWDGRYEVSNLGRLRNRHGKVIRPSLGERGYYQVGLYGDSGQRSFRLHRLIALAFVSNPHGHPHVNHLDCDKLNNAATNLEWTTFEANFAHGREAGVALAKNNPKVRRKLSAAQVIDIRSRQIKTWPECKAVGEEFGVSASHVYNITNGRKRARG